MAGQLVMSGVKQTTAKAYSSTQRSFLAFCQALKLTPLPATEQTILKYIAWLYKKGMASGSYNVHLSAIRNLHIINSVPHDHIRTDKVKLALRSIWISSPGPAQKHALDFNLLVKLWPLVQKSTNTYMWQALLSLGFYGGLRGAEYTQVNSSEGPKVQSVTFSSCGKVMNFKVNSSKTKSHGFVSVLGCSDHEICAPCTMKRYLKNRLLTESVTNSSSLFIDQNARAIHKKAVDSFIKGLVASIGLDANNYSTHSLRSGAATSAASVGCNEYEIQAIGGWRSQVYKQYIHNKAEITRTWPKRLTRGKQN